MSVSESHSDGSHRLESYRYVHGPIWFAIGSILADRLLAAILWQYESNPVVIELGFLTWIFLTLVLLFGMAFAWYSAMGVDNSIVRALVYGIGIFHTIAVISNFWIVFLS